MPNEDNHDYAADMPDTPALEAPDTPATPDSGTPDSGTPDIPHTEGADSPDAPDTKGEDPRAKSRALLDSISEPDPNAPPKKEGEEEEEEPAAARAKPEDKTPDQEEAELLEGVKSERGKERIKSMLAGKRQLQADLNEFREMVVSTGMSPNQFAQTLEFGRLMNSATEADKRTALAMLDATRAELVKELGIEAPGVDPLADFKDLHEAVENMEMTRERAIELAKYRRRDALMQQNAQTRQAHEQESQAYQQQIAQAASVAEQYFKTREKEPDYPMKMRQIHAWFANEDNKREFIQTYEPRQWFGVFKMMYDNIRVVQPTGARPISSKPAHMGAARTDGMDNQSRLMARLDNMGI